MKNRSFLPFWASVLLAAAACASLGIAFLPSDSFPGVHGSQKRAAEESIVQRLVDGDTVVLANGDRVRYIGMDTPELHHPRKPVQVYAREAMEFNRNLVEGKTVLLEFDVERYDKYNRLLAYVFLQDGTFVNAELVRQGYAHILTIPPDVKYAGLFLKYEREARKARRGLWGLK